MNDIELAEARHLGLLDELTSLRRRVEVLSGRTWLLLGVNLVTIGALIWRG